MKIVRASHAAIGLVIMGISLFFTAINAGYILLFFLFIVPGFLFGIYLKDEVDINVKELKKSALIIISGCVYMLCFWMLKIGDTEDFW